MPDFLPVSRAQLAERRRRLRRERRWRAMQASWRMLAVSGLAIALLWGTTLPTWVIRSPSQVKVQGNQLLSPQIVQSLLPITYPQSLLAIQPQTIADHLESKGPIAEAIVKRQLFPPGLTIQIRERRPVAIAYTSAASAATVSSQSSGGVLSGVGLLDEKGHWIAVESYTTMTQSIELPTLKVIGNPEQYRSQWSQLYQQVSRSPVKVAQIDWQDPANLILTTDLGLVHIGSYSSRFAEQLRALDQLRQLPQTIDPKEIAYIDLRNLDAPLVQMNQTGASQPLTSQ